jgi:hypothetical protein
MKGLMLRGDDDLGAMISDFGVEDLFRLHKMAFAVIIPIVLLDPINASCLSITYLYGFNASIYLFLGADAA